MESTTYNQKRRGFIKGKLMPSFNQKICSNKVKRSHGGNNNNNKNPNSVVNQDAKPEPLQMTLAYVVPQDRGYDSSIGRIESFFGDMDDEGVNIKAANYILSVHERFRMEGTVSERNHQNGEL